MDLKSKKMILIAMKLNNANYLQLKFTINKIVNLEMFTNVCCHYTNLIKKYKTNLNKTGLSINLLFVTSSINSWQLTQLIKLIHYLKHIICRVLTRHGSKIYSWIGRIPNLYHSFFPYFINGYAYWTNNKYMCICSFKPT